MCAVIQQLPFPSVRRSRRSVRLEHFQYYFIFVDLLCLVLARILFWNSLEMRVPRGHVLVGVAAVTGVAAVAVAWFFKLRRRPAVRIVELVSWASKDPFVTTQSNDPNFNHRKKMSERVVSNANRESAIQLSQKNNFPCFLSHEQGPPTKWFLADEGDQQAARAHSQQKRRGRETAEADWRGAWKIAGSWSAEFQTCVTAFAFHVEFLCEQHQIWRCESKHQCGVNGSSICFFVVSNCDLFLL